MNPPQPIAPFDTASGYLPPGLHPASVEHLRQQFVDGLGHAGGNRATLFGGYTRLVEALQMTGMEVEQWIGGSFVSRVEQPGDIDLVNFCDAAAFEALSAQTRALVSLYLRGKETARHCHCDSYYAPKAPPQHPAGALFERLAHYWRRRLGQDWNGIAKGIVQVALAPPQPAEEANHAASA